MSHQRWTMCLRLLQAPGLSVDDGGCTGDWESSHVSLPPISNVIILLVLISDLQKMKEAEVYDNMGRVF